MLRNLQHIKYSFSKRTTLFNPQMNYYKILEVTNVSTSQQIRQAYKKLAKDYHPDVSKTDADKFQQITEAYKVLSDDILRRQYDRARQEEIKKQAELEFRERAQQPEYEGKDIVLEVFRKNWNHLKRTKRQFIKGVGGGLRKNDQNRVNDISTKYTVMFYCGSFIISLIIFEQIQRATSQFKINQAQAT